MKQQLKLFLTLIFCLNLFLACEKVDNTAPEPVSKSALEKLKERARNLPQTENNKNYINRTLIFYASNKKGTTNQRDNWEIWAMDLSEDELNGTVQLTNNDAYDCYWPRVSPDKTKMLFYRTPSGFKESDYQKYSLWVMDLSTFEEEELVSLDRYGWKKQGTASWSPNGQKIAMFGLKNSDNKQSLFITDPQGNILEEINNGGGKYTDPSWSPDGGSLCFSKNEDIYTVHIADNKEQRMTCDDYLNFDPFWSPDGKTIAFESNVKLFENCLLGRWNIKTVTINEIPSNATCAQINVRTKNVRGGENKGHAVPRWLFDSNYLVFHYGENCSVAHLALMKKDGSGFYRETIGGRDYGKTSPDIYDF